jgi:cell division transport system permease protein
MKSSFFLSEALGSLRRNWVMTIAAVLTVFISMAILGSVLVIDRNLNQGATSLKNRVMIEVFLKDSATPAQVAQMKERIEAMPEFKSLTYVSKDQALEEFRERLQGNAASILSNLSTNPLPASFRIYVKNPNEVDAVAARFYHDPIVANSPEGLAQDPPVYDGVKYAKQTVRKMLGTIGLIEKGMWVATIVFAAAAVLLISTTVRLSIFARRREIEIMRLVGATNWFIRWPFVVEGFITGLVGSIVAGLAVFGVNWMVYNWIENSSVNFLGIEKYPVWMQGGQWPLGLLPTLALLGAVLGAAGSALALRRYLRV